MRNFEIVIPASTSNIGPGFDCLGMALSIYNKLRIHYESKKEYFHINWTGKYSYLINKKIEDRFKKFIIEFFEKEKATLPPLNIEFEVNIPLFRGLGSSATAIIGAYYIVKNTLALNINKDDILSILYPYEGHPDNLTPSLLGGMTISTVANNKVYYKKYKISEKWKIAVIIPNFIVPTKEARQILPKSYKREDIIFNLSRLPFLINSFLNGTRNLSIFIEDRLHQPYRAKLMPFFEKIAEISYEMGADGVAISGAGSSIIIFSQNNIKNIGEKSLELLKSMNIDGEVLYPSVDNDGVKVIS